MNARAFATALVGLALVACGGDDDSDKAAGSGSTPSRSKATPTAELFPALRGTYTTVGRVSEGFESAGRYTLILGARRYTTINPARERHSGTLSLGADRLYFTDKGCADEPGVYRWRLDGTKLRLTAVDSDGCSAREQLLTYADAPWRKR